MPPAPRLASNDPAELAALLALMRNAFAYMDGRIDPPSSLAAWDGTRLAAETRGAELWVLGPVTAPLSCMLLTPREDHLYLGKLAVAPEVQGTGLGAHMVSHATARARALNLPALRLQTRIELTGNHAAFARMGFAEVGRTAHPGYARPTSLTFERRV